MWMVVVLAQVLTVSLIPVVVAYVVGSLPKDYFVAAEEDGAQRLSPLRIFSAIGRNFVGGTLVLVGLIVTLPIFPLIPGTGLVVAACGLVIADFPGKRRALTFMVKPRKVSWALNWIRARLGRDQFVLPEEEPRSPKGTTAETRTNAA